MAGVRLRNLFALSLLLLMAFSFDLKTCLAARNSEQKTSTEFIRSSCDATVYPRLCVSSLSARGDLIQTSPRLLAHEALTVALSTAKSTTSSMVQLSGGSGGRDPREVAAMTDCMEELSDAMEQIRKSIGEMDGIKQSNFEIVAGNVQTWVSAALTDETTCMDGFQGTKGKAKEDVRRRVVVIARMTSNALALVNRYASLHHV